MSQQPKRFEVLFANAQPTDVVHIAASLGPRWFRPLCTPEVTHYGDLAASISVGHKRCASCARKAAILWDHKTQASSDAHTAANR